MACSNTMRGQVSLELLVTLGIVIAFTVPIIFLLLSVSSVGYEKAAKDQADASARTLSDGINTVYAQGHGAKRIVLLNLPSSTKELRINGSEVIVKIETSVGEYEGVSPVFAQIDQPIVFTGRTGLFSVSVMNFNEKVNMSESK